MLRLTNITEAFGSFQFSKLLPGHTDSKEEEIYPEELPTPSAIEYYELAIMDLKGDKNKGMHDWKADLQSAYFKAAACYSDIGNSMRAMKYFLEYADFGVEYPHRLEFRLERVAALYNSLVAEGEDSLREAARDLFQKRISQWRDKNSFYKFPHLFYSRVAEFYCDIFHYHHAFDAYLMAAVVYPPRQYWTAIVVTDTGIKRVQRYIEHDEAKLPATDTAHPHTSVNSLCKALEILGKIAYESYSQFENLREKICALHKSLDDPSPTYSLCKRAGEFFVENDAKREGAHLLSLAADCKKRDGANGEASALFLRAAETYANVNHWLESAKMYELAGCYSENDSAELFMAAASHYDKGKKRINGCICLLRGLERCIEQKKGSIEIKKLLISTSETIEILVEEDRYFSQEKQELAIISTRLSRRFDERKWDREAAICCQIALFVEKHLHPWLSHSDCHLIGLAERWRTVLSRALPIAAEKLDQEITVSFSKLPVKRCYLLLDFFENAERKIVEDMRIIQALISTRGVNETQLKALATFLTELAEGSKESRNCLTTAAQWWERLSLNKEGKESFLPGEIDLAISLSSHPPIFEKWIDLLEKPSFFMNSQFVSRTVKSKGALFEEVINGLREKEETLLEGEVVSFMIKKIALWRDCYSLSLYNAEPLVESIEGLGLFSSALECRLLLHWQKKYPINVVKNNLQNLIKLALKTEERVYSWRVIEIIIRYCDAQYESTPSAHSQLYDFLREAAFSFSAKNLDICALRLFEVLLLKNRKLIWGNVGASIFISWIFSFYRNSAPKEGEALSEEEARGRERAFGCAIAEIETLLEKGPKGSKKSLLKMLIYEQEFLQSKLTTSPSYQELIEGAWRAFLINKELMEEGEESRNIPLLKVVMESPHSRKNVAIVKNLLPLGAPLRTNESEEDLRELFLQLQKIPKQNIKVVSDLVQSIRQWENSLSTLKSAVALIEKDSVHLTYLLQLINVMSCESAVTMVNYLSTLSSSSLKSQLVSNLHGQSTNDDLESERDDIVEFFLLLASFVDRSSTGEIFHLKLLKNLLSTPKEDARERVFRLVQQWDDLEHLYTVEKIIDILLLPHNWQLPMATKFMLSLEDFSLPEQLLLKMRAIVRLSGTFPKTIGYKSSTITVDIGGVSRDFVARLFKALYDDKVPAWAGDVGKQGVIPKLSEGVSGAESMMQMHYYHSIGMFFARALLDKGNNKTGVFFHPLLFKMLHGLNNDDIESIGMRSEGVLSLEGDLAEGYYRKLLKLYILRSPFAPSFGKNREELLAAIDAMVERNVLPSDLSELGIATTEQFLEEYGIHRILLAVISIAKGIADYSGRDFWDSSKRASAALLAVDIQGTLDRVKIQKSLTFSYDSKKSKLYHRRKSELYLRSWICNAPEKLLSQFLLAIGGSCSLPQGQKLTIKLEGAANRFPSYQSCFYSMNLSEAYPNYETFKEKLETSIKNAIQSAFTEA